jgi:hypothetical protein
LAKNASDLPTLPVRWLTKLEEDPPPLQRLAAFEKQLAGQGNFLTE